MRRSAVFGMLAVLALSWDVAAQDTLSPLARSIQDDLNRLDSRVSARDDDRLESDRLERTPRERGQAARLFTPTPQRSAQDISLSSDLGAVQQDLRTLKTSEPDANSIPLLERQYDRISREAGGGALYQPSRDPAALYAR
jgi:hypothetical protein